MATPETLIPTSTPIISAHTEKIPLLTIQEIEQQIHKATEHCAQKSDAIHTTTAEACHTLQAKITPSNNVIEQANLDTEIPSDLLQEFSIEEAQTNQGETRAKQCKEKISQGEHLVDIEQKGLALTKKINSAKNPDPADIQALQALTSETLAFNQPTIEKIEDTKISLDQKNDSNEAFAQSIRKTDTLTSDTDIAATLAHDQKVKTGAF